MPEFKKYRRRDKFSELRPYEPGEVLPLAVSVSVADQEAGSPKQGDWIARNPDNHDDQWLMSAAYFAANMDPVPVENIEVVKVQLPLGSSQKNPPAMIYNRSKRRLCFVPVTEELRAQMGTRPKRYFHATWDGDTWSLKEPVQDEVW